MSNIPLFIFDVLCLPITLIRFILIYFFGSRYGVPFLRFMDTMAHSKYEHFNYGHSEDDDTTNTDVRVTVNKISRIKPPEPHMECKCAGGNKIVLNGGPIDEDDQKKLQNMLPKILSQISSRIDESKIDEEMRKELDFLSFEPESEKPKDAIHDGLTDTNPD